MSTQMTMINTNSLLVQEFSKLNVEARTRLIGLKKLLIVCTAYFKTIDTQAFQTNEEKTQALSSGFKSLNLLGVKFKTALEQIYGGAYPECILEDCCLFMEICLSEEGTEVSLILKNIEEHLENMNEIFSLDTRAPKMEDELFSTFLEEITNLETNAQSMNENAADSKTTADSKTGADNKTTTDSKTAADSKTGGENKTAVDSKTGADNKTATDSKTGGDNKTAADRKIVADNKTATINKTAAGSAGKFAGKYSRRLYTETASVLNIQYYSQDILLCSSNLRSAFENELRSEKASSPLTVTNGKKMNICVLVNNVLFGTNITLDGAILKQILYQFKRSFEETYKLDTSEIEAIRFDTESPTNNLIEDNRVYFKKCHFTISLPIELAHKIKRRMAIKESLRGAETAMHNKFVEHIRKKQMGRGTINVSASVLISTASAAGTNNSVNTHTAIPPILVETSSSGTAVLAYSANGRASASTSASTPATATATAPTMASTSATASDTNAGSAGTAAYADDNLDIFDIRVGTRVKHEGNKMFFFNKK